MSIEYGSGSSILARTPYFDFANSISTGNELLTLDGFLDTLSRLDSSVVRNDVFTSAISELSSDVLADSNFQSFLINVDPSVLTNDEFTSFLKSADPAVLQSESFVSGLLSLDKSIFRQEAFTKAISEVSTSDLTSEAFGNLLSNLNQSQELLGTALVDSLVAQIDVPDLLNSRPGPLANDLPLDVEGTITGGTSAGRLIDGVDSDVRTVGFREIKSPSNPGTLGQTWVVIHGWNDTPVRADGFIEIAGLIDTIEAEVADNDRVLALDWREAAGNVAGTPSQGVVNAATWITPTAEFAVETLKNEYGISSDYAKNQLNLVGHSLGPYVAAEIGRLFQTDNSVGVRTITALDPGAEITAPNARFNLDGREEGGRVFTPFSDVAAFSRSFYGESSSFGSRRNSLTADEAYQMDFSFRAGNGPRPEHFRVLRAFRNFANEPGLIGELLGIPAYRFTDGSLPVNNFGTITEGRDRNRNSSTGFEGIINVNSENEPTLLVSQRQTGERDSIVIGSKLANTIAGLEITRRGQQTSATGSSRFFEEGNDKIFGEGSNDDIEGKGGNDIISGGAGSDVLDGGQGSDILYGGDELGLAQQDQLIGGGGSDIFAISRVNAADTLGQVDVIKDFSLAEDRIGLIGSLNSGELILQDSGSGISIGTSQDGLLANVEGSITVDDFINSSRNLFTANNFSGTALADAFVVA